MNCISGTKANRADLDGMPHIVASHLDMHYLLMAIILDFGINGLAHFIPYLI